MGLTSDAASCCGTALSVRASIVSLSRRRLGPDTNEGQTAQDSPAEPRVLPAPLWAARPSPSARYAQSAPAPSAFLPGPCLTLPQPPCPCLPSPRAPVDGNFCHVALQYKIHIKEQLPKALSAVCKEQVTRCVMEELRRLGPDFSGALFIAKRFEMRRCSHKEPVSAAECLASLVGTLPWRAEPRPSSARAHPHPALGRALTPPLARPRPLIVPRGQQPQQLPGGDPGHGPARAPAQGRLGPAPLPAVQHAPARAAVAVLHPARQTGPSLARPVPSVPLLAQTANE